MSSQDGFQEIHVNKKHRIVFEGSIDAASGNGFGKLSQINLLNGLEEVSIEGHLQAGFFHGKVAENEYECSKAEAFYQRGQRHGYFRLFRWDHKFVDMTCFISGHRVQNLSCTKVAGSAFDVKIPGRRIYLYPGLYYGYVNGLFAKVCQVISVFLYGFPCIEASEKLATDEIVFDPSTVTRLSRQPLRSDPYEDIHVYVSPSTISPQAGEGLFAKENIEKGQLVCLFNGIRRTKEGRAAKAISWHNEDWSDYRLFLGKFNLYTQQKSAYISS